MVDKIPALSKKQRRQRRKDLQRALRRLATRRRQATPPVAPPVAANPTSKTQKRRGRKRRKPLTAADVKGVKYFQKLTPLLAPLHDIGCERDKAGNRKLHYDQLCSFLLLGLFNPVVDGLRGLQQASELEKVQQRLKVRRTSLGSFSEASRVFDAELLQPILKELGGELQPLARDRRLSGIPQTLTLVDGTLLPALPLLVQAMLLKERTGSGMVKWRLHTHFEVDRFVPTRIDVTPNGGGEHDERAVLERTLESDHLYVMDRGYAKFGLFNRIVKADSSYVCRLRDNSAYEVVEERPLTDADRAAGYHQRPNRAIHPRQSRRPPRSSDPPGVREVLAAHRSRQVPWQFQRSRQRRRAADRYQPAGGAGRDHRVDLPVSMDHRAVLQILQADPWLPPSLLPQPKRHQAVGLLRDHRLYAPVSVDRPQADQADLRDGLLLLPGSGHGGGVAGPHREAEAARRRPEPQLTNHGHPRSGTRGV